MSKDKLIIFDTTMRDGEQSPGASMTKDEKLRIARQLERMRVDVIEAGFPAASDGDFEAVKAVASIIKDSTVCGLARANEQDVRRCGEAVRGARSPRVTWSWPTRRRSASTPRTRVTSRFSWRGACRACRSSSAPTATRRRAWPSSGSA